MKSIALYAIGLIALGLLALISIPAMIQLIGPTRWGHLGVMQTAGLWASAVISYGWHVNGPSEAGRHPTSAHLRLILESFKLRIPIFLISIAVIIGITAQSPGNAIEPILAFSSTAILGLRVSWLYIGNSQPAMLLICETVPRIVFTGAGIFLGLTYKDISLLLWGPIVGIFSSMLIAILVTLRYSRDPTQTRSFRQLFAVNKHAFVSSILGATYSSAPVFIVAWAAPQSLPLYILVDRVWMQANTAYSPVMDFLRSQMSSASNQTKSRGNQIAKVSLGCLSSAAILYLVFSEKIMSILSHGQIHVPILTAVAFAIVFIASNMTWTMVDIILASLGQLEKTTKATLISLLIALPLCYILATHFGATGAIVALIFGYLIRILRSYWVLMQYETNRFYNTVDKESRL